MYHHPLTTFQGHVFGPACRLLSSKYKLSHLSLVSPQVSVNNKEKPFVESDTNVSINIPPKTTLAYSVIELDVSNTGHYGKSFLPNHSITFQIRGSQLFFFSRSRTDIKHQVETQHTTKIVYHTEV